MTTVWFLLALIAFPSAQGTRRMRVNRLQLQEINYDGYITGSGERFSISQRK
jgi:hypothetical protein